jgi:hypothetical protein
MEKLRDPSHVGALKLASLRKSFQDAGLSEPSIAHRKMTVELEAVLNASFPNEGDKERVREMVVASLDHDSMGTLTHLRGEKVVFSYPIALFVATVT